MNKTDNILVAGSETPAGKALLRYLLTHGFSAQSLTTAEILNRDGLRMRFAEYLPDHVFATTGISGGIRMNQKFPAEIMANNLQAALNLFEACRIHGVSKLLYLASSCIYPAAAQQPLRPEALGTGPLESTCQAYAQAKLAAVELVRSYRLQYDLKCFSVIPADVFGPDDDFHPEHSHVIGALLRKMHEAKYLNTGEAVVWGSGNAVRDFLYSSDLASACCFLMQQQEIPVSPVNVSAENYLTIREIAEAIKAVTGYHGRLKFDSSAPEGVFQKTLSAAAIKQMGWKPEISFQEGLVRTYQAFLKLESRAYLHV